MNPEHLERCVADIVHVSFLSYPLKARCRSRVLCLRFRWVDVLLLLHDKCDRRNHQEKGAAADYDAHDERDVGIFAITIAVALLADIILVAGRRWRRRV